MCQFGAVIQPDNDPSVCAAAVADLNLDLVLLTYQYMSSPDWTSYDNFYNTIPPGQILALIQITAGSGWSSVTQSELANFALEVKQRYPGLGYFAIINEPDVAATYPPSGIDPTTYLTYYNAVKNAILNNPRVIPHGPDTSQYDASYNPGDGRQYFHGYGANPPYVRRYYWMTELESKTTGGQPDPISCWSKYKGYGAAIFYLLQDSEEQQSFNGLITAGPQGQPKQPVYDNAKQYLYTPT